jgi:integrase
VQPPRIPELDLPIWDDEQTRVFLGEAKRSSPYHLFYVVMIFTSARPCEVLALTWRDIDFLARVVHIRRKFIRIGKQQITGATKTKAVEAVTIPDPLAEDLRDLRRSQDEQRRLLGPAYEDRGLVFCQPNGRPLHAHNISQRDFRQVVERAGLPRIRMYDLRALSATTQLDLGVPLHVVQRRTRHKQPNTLLKHYARVLASKEREAADLLSERLLGSK